MTCPAAAPRQGRHQQAGPWAAGSGRQAVDVSLGPVPDQPRADQHTRGGAGTCLQQTRCPALWLPASWQACADRMPCAQQQAANRAHRGSPGRPARGARPARHPRPAQRAPHAPHQAQCPCCWRAAVVPAPGEQAFSVLLQREHAPLLAASPGRRAAGWQDGSGTPSTGRALPPPEIMRPALKVWRVSSRLQCALCRGGLAGRLGPLDHAGARPAPCVPGAGRHGGCSSCTFRLQLQQRQALGQARGWQRCRCPALHACA